MSTDPRHPYRVECQKHGVHYESTDECMQCFNDEMEKDRGFPNSICWGCMYCQDEPRYFVRCYAPKWKIDRIQITPRKKHCKYFTRWKGEWS